MEPDLQQIISQAVSFALLFLLLKRFAWKPLLAMLDQRRARIEQEFAQAAKGREELARLQQDYAKRLSAIEEEARTKIQQAILEGKRVSGEIQEQARQQASAIFAKSQETIEMELAKARHVLRDQMAQMTVEAVERILRDKLDAKTDRRLVDDILAELDKEQARS